MSPEWEEAFSGHGDFMDELLEEGDGSGAKVDVWAPKISQGQPKRTVHYISVFCVAAFLSLTLEISEIVGKKRPLLWGQLSLTAGSGKPALINNPFSSLGQQKMCRATC